MPKTSLAWSAHHTQEIIRKLRARQQQHAQELALLDTRTYGQILRQTITSPQNKSHG